MIWIHDDLIDDENGPISAQEIGQIMFENFLDLRGQ